MSVKYSIKFKLRIFCCRQQNSSGHAGRDDHAGPTAGHRRSEKLLDG